MMRKQIGVSKDSGIHSMSRPVTASDYRESPEVRETTFEPILKDLQKLPPVPSSLATSQPSSLSSQKKRPPTSLIRFSPQMEEKPPAHELSTIVEVETPVASKLNILEDDRVDLTKESINYENFPDYEEYLNIANRQTTDDLQKLFEMSQLKYQEFVQPAVYGIKETVVSKKEDDEVNSTDSSIHDIVAELKRRNIINRSFDNLSSTGGESDGPAAKLPEDQLDRILKSPTQRTQHVPESRVSESSRILPSPPPTQKIQKSPKKNQTASKSDSPRLEDDLTDMGMPWMTSMLKRNQESNTIQSSSSSASVNVNQEKKEQHTNRPSRKTYQIEIRDPNTSSPTTNSSTDTVSTGKPLNLKDFLRRELTIRSENKNLTNESSLSSKFMHSLLNATGGTSSTNSDMQSQDQKLRTSTPVQLDSTRLGASIFSADSRMSSVRMSSSGEEKKSPT